MSMVEGKGGSFQRYLLQTERICNLKGLRVIAVMESLRLGSSVNRPVRTRMLSGVGR